MKPPHLRRLTTEWRPPLHPSKASGGDAWSVAQLLVEISRGQHVSLERWRDLDDEVLQLRILNCREQRARDGVDHGFMKRDFVLQKGMVKGGTVQAAELFHRCGVIASALIILRRRRRHAELLRQVAPLLPNSLVVARQHRA